MCPNSICNGSVTAGRSCGICIACALADVQAGQGTWREREEKGGKSREIAVRHDLEQIIEAYITVAGLEDAPADTPLFRPAVRRENRLASKPMQENDMCRMVKRRLKKADLPQDLSAHSFRVATITNLIGQGIPIEDVQQLAKPKMQGRQSCMTAPTERLHEIWLSGLRSKKTKRPCHHLATVRVVSQALSENCCASRLPC